MFFLLDLAFFTLLLAFLLGRWAWRRCPLSAAWLEREFRKAPQRAVDPKWQARQARYR
jgi:hypothetical protein